MPDAGLWEGEGEHLAIQGRIRGADIDVRLDSTVASDVSRFFCRREYTVQSSGRPLASEVFCDAFTTVNGREGKIQVEFKRHDWQNETVGKPVTVVLRDNLVEPKPDQCWWEYEWHNKVVGADGGVSYAKEYAVDAFEGAVTMQLYSGEPVDGGVLKDNTGKAGFSGEGRWSEDERLRLSLTGRFTTNNLVTP